MSLSVIVGTVSLVLIVTTGVIFYYRDEQLKKDTQTKMQGLVDQINDSHYYEYKFDKKQDQNVKNIDQNVTQVYDSVVKLQNNVKFIEQNALLQDDTKKQFNTNKAIIGTLQANRATVANNTGKNNIVIEGGRTLDGNNEGWSAINFNGYYDNGEKRIDGTKGRFRLISDQRAGADNMIIDQWDKNNNWHQYMMMADGTIGINDNKLRFSNKWTGFPDGATDQSEISNDTGGFKELMIVGNKSGGAERRVGVWDTLNVHGTTNANGDTNINGRLRIAKGDGEWNWLNVVGNHNDQLLLGSDAGNRGIWAAGPRDFTIYNQGQKGLTVRQDGSLYTDKWLNYPNNGAGINWGNGYSQIFDNGNLHINTDDEMNISAPWKLNINTPDINLSGAINVANKWRLGDTGDEWLRLNIPGKPNADINNYYGGFAAGKFWTNTGQYIQGSDRRIKDNIENINNSQVNDLLKLNPKTYTYKDDVDNTKRFGFIAQDVEQIYPEMVTIGPNGMKSMNYTDIIPLTVANIKNLSKKINTIAPNDKQVCIDGVCLTKEDILKLKNL